MLGCVEVIVRGSGSSLPPTQEAVQTLWGYSKCIVESLSLLPLNNLNVDMIYISSFFFFFFFHLFIFFLPMDNGVVVFRQSFTVAVWRIGNFYQAELWLLVRASGHIKGTGDAADHDSPLIHHVSGHLHNATEEVLIILHCRRHSHTNLPVVFCALVNWVMIRSSFWQPRRWSAAGRRAGAGS